MIALQPRSKRRGSDATVGVVRGNDVGRPPASVRQSLRSATASLHSRLHRAPLLHDLQRGSLTLPGYGELLARLSAVYSPLDRCLDGAVSRYSALRDLGPYRPRSPLLQRDLADLAIQGGRWETAPQASDIPHIEAACQALGVLYVVEGSALGAGFLATKLDMVLGDNPDGRAYFTWCAGRGGLPWGRLCEAIETFGGQPRAMQQMISAAQRTFSLFLRSLDETCPHGDRISVTMDDSHA